jgi:dienelactone hydrolase
MKPYKSWLALLALVAATAAWIAAQPVSAGSDPNAQSVNPSYAEATEVDGGEIGPYPVGHTSFVTDANEPGRKVAIDVYYPADAGQITEYSAEAEYVAFPYENTSPAMTSSQWEEYGYDPAYEAPAPARGPFPLVMFGTALADPGWGYVYLGTRLASHGYVVAVVEAYREGTWVDHGGNYEWFVAKMYHRPRDISSALTVMLKRNRTGGDLLQNLMDPRYVVAAGHSFGGYAALVLAGGDDQIADSSAVPYFDGKKPPPTGFCQPSPPDPRFTAIMCLDAPADWLRWEELSRIRVPSLIMGQAHWADWSEAPWDSFVARPHAAISANTRALRVDIAQSDHLSFQDASDGLTILHDAGLISDASFDTRASWWLTGQQGYDVLPNREVQRMITKYVVAWLGAEVVKDGSDLSKRILTQRYTKANEPNVEVFWNEKCDCGGTLQPGTFTYFKDMAPDACVVADQNPEGFFIPYP